MVGAGVAQGAPLCSARPAAMQAGCTDVSLTPRSACRSPAVIASKGRINLAAPPGGWTVSQAALDAQLAVASADFAPAGVAFRQASLTWHDNSEWARGCANFTLAYQIAAAVVREPERALNVALCSLGGVLGYALSLPNPFSFDEAMGGQLVALDFQTLPGGPLGPYSAGRTFTHEVRAVLRCGLRWGRRGEGSPGRQRGPPL